MLIDEVIINVKAGNGGNGALSFRRNAQTPKGGPDGGNGGKGGDVYCKGIDDFTALAEFRYKKNILGEDGVKGGRNNLFGRNGKDITMMFPIGSQVTNLDTQESFEITDTNTKILLAKGGRGGRGNNEFKTSTNQAPYYAEKGELGEEKKLKLELKLIADIGIIGFPNSGKSSLLSVLTNAHPKIGDYPFTTLEPNLGVLNGLIIADIPGFIEGASQGRGLGDKFLKHIEKTRILVHCLDSLSSDLKSDYQTVRKELEAYNLNLLNKKELLVLTKNDLVDEKITKKNKKIVEKLNKNYLIYSIYDTESISVLKDKIIGLSN